MRIVRGLSIAAAAVLVLVGAAMGPLWAAPAATPNGTDAVPAELFGMLFQECVGETQLGNDEWLEPSLTEDLSVEVTLVRMGDGDAGSVPVELDDRQSTEIAGINECFADFEVDPEYRGVPTLDAFHRAMLDDHLARIVGPCLSAAGVDDPPTFPADEPDMLQWYLRGLEQLGFDKARELWWSCPLVPEYLEEAAYSTQDPAGAG